MYRLRLKDQRNGTRGAMAQPTSTRISLGSVTFVFSPGHTLTSDTSLLPSGPRLSRPLAPTPGPVPALVDGPQPGAFLQTRRGRSGESCSCLYGNACVDAYMCRDWARRYEVAERNRLTRSGAVSSTVSAPYLSAPCLVPRASQIVRRAILRADSVGLPHFIRFLGAYY